LQPTRYWPQFCALMGIGAAADDPRFSSLESMAANAEAAFAMVSEAIGARTLAECTRLLKQSSGQWAPVQDGWDLANDAALLANGRIVEVVDAEGTPQKLVANPVKFDDDPLTLTRAPQFAEHTDDVLRELGFDDEQIIELKIAGAIT
jgi:crotonobetainyl-CoA:carnitine CoA-transferase CaiB-like acyl-CoA transferase